MVRLVLQRVDDTQNNLTLPIDTSKFHIILTGCNYLHASKTTVNNTT